MKVWYAHKNGTPLLDHWFPMCAAERFVSFTDHQAALDEILKEAVWAMETIQWLHAQLHIDTRCLQATKVVEFLALPLVQDYLKRKEGKQ